MCVFISRACVLVFICVRVFCVFVFLVPFLNSQSLRKSGCRVIDVVEDIDWDGIQIHIYTYIYIYEV